MNKIDDFATELNNNNKSFTNKVKSHVFDVIALGLVAAIGLLNLGAIEIKDLTTEYINIMLEAIPFYIGSVALALNYYKKGVYAGKSSKSFNDIVCCYSSTVNTLVGKQIDKLNDFCSYYNKKALRLRQETILQNVAISFERFDCPTDGSKPLKIMSDEELIKEFGEVIAKAIIEAKNVKVKGVNANVLLGNNHIDDVTDLGKSEQEMLKTRSKEYSIVYFASIIVMSMMGVKDILEWGWMGAFLLVFKMLYILCRSYMKYFEGYDDITVKLSNHMSRKIDILKEFDCWYEDNFGTIGNNL